MAQQNFAKLAAQGRAYDSTRNWSEDELTTLLSIEKEGVQRSVAAEYVRNGIRTVEEYKKAVEVGFSPKSFEELQKEAIEAHMKSVRSELATVTEAEVVVENEVVEPEVVEPEVVVETAEVVVENEVVEPEVVEPEVAAPGFPKAKGGKKATNNQ